MPAWSPDDTGTVTFTDSAHNTVTVNVTGGTTSYTADLHTLTDGTITSSLQVKTDPAGNSFTPVAGTSITLDQDSGEQAALSLSVTNTDVGASAAKTVPFTIAGLESDDTGTVTFTDSAHNTVTVARQRRHDQLHRRPAHADRRYDHLLAAGRHRSGRQHFTPVAGTSITLDQDSGEQAALSLSVTNTDVGQQRGHDGSVHDCRPGVLKTPALSPSPTSAHNTVTVNVTGGTTSYTGRPHTLTDGTITSSLQVATDPAGNSFTPVAGTSITLDQDSGEQAALSLSVTNTDVGQQRGQDGAVHDCRPGSGRHRHRHLHRLGAQYGDGERQRRHDQLHRRPAHADRRYDHLLAAGQNRSGRQQLHAGRRHQHHARPG